MDLDRNNRTCGHGWEEVAQFPGQTADLGRGGGEGGGEAWQRSWSGLFEEGSYHNALYEMVMKWSYETNV